MADCVWQWFQVQQCSLEGFEDHSIAPRQRVDWYRETRCFPQLIGCTHVEKLGEWEILKVLDLCFLLRARSRYLEKSSNKKQPAQLTVLFLSVEGGFLRMLFVGRLTILRALYPEGPHTPYKVG